MTKPSHFKPGLYALFFEQLKDIANLYGYNLCLHGSANRDLDLVLIPWSDRCNFKLEQRCIQEFEDYLTGVQKNNVKGEVPFNVNPGKRRTYTIQLNRGDRHGEWVRFEDKQWYLDISIPITYETEPLDEI